MYTSFAVMGVDSDFGGVTIALDNPKEDSEVELEASSIHILGDVVTNNGVAKNWRNGVMGKSG